MRTHQLWTWLAAAVLASSAAQAFGQHNNQLPLRLLNEDAARRSPVVLIGEALYPAATCDEDLPPAAMLQTDLPPAAAGKNEDEVSPAANLEQIVVPDCDVIGPDWDCDWVGPSGPYRLFKPREGGFNIQGWMNGGYVGNTGSPASKFNGPYNAVDRSNEPMFNQLYLIAEKSLSADAWGIGMRLDAIYGEDHLLAQSVGLERRPDGGRRWNGEYYGVALPQAYVEVGRSDLSLKVGHFYAVVGYETLTAPNNFFYSKAYSYQFAGPFTLWGGMASWKPNDNWQLLAGLTNGWDTLDRDLGNRVNAHVAAKFTADAGWWSSFSIATGDNINNPGQQAIADQMANRTRYSLLTGVPLTDKLEYVFHHWLGSQADGKVGGGTALWYGIDQYLYYTINEQWKAGARMEWFCDQDGTRVGLNRASNPNKVPFVGNFASLSVGANWTPHPNVIFRPEIRADWFDGGQAIQPYQDGAQNSQLMLGLDGILLF